jgi:hypothetical protein
MLGLFNSQKYATSNDIEKLWEYLQEDISVKDAIAKKVEKIGGILMRMDVLEVDVKKISEKVEVVEGERCGHK